MAFLEKTMLKKILLFEIKNSLFKLSSLIYFIFIFFISFFLALFFADTFQGITINYGLLELNSPIILNDIITSIGFLGILIIAPIFGQSMNKDFETEFRQIIFSMPISKATYFFVRYFGSVITTIIILSSIGLSIWIATLMPFINKQFIEENHFVFYITPYLFNIIPNILFFGALFIAIISFFHKMSPIYFCSILIFMGYIIAQRIMGDIDNKFIASLIDPFGSVAMQNITEYWSIAEQKTKIISLTGFYLYNRLFWITLGSFFLSIGYFLFNPFKLQKEKKISNKTLFTFNKLKKINIALKPKSLKVLLEISISEFKQAFSNIYFIIILFCGILYLVIASMQIGKIYGTETLPVTYHVLEGIGGSFQLFIVIIITYYAGELVWKDREKKIYELTDSKPISNLFFYLSKLSSLILLQVFLSCLILITCLFIQILSSYYFFEWNIYFQYLFMYFLLPNIFICILTLFIQTISKNKYIGHSIVVFYYFLLFWLPSIGFDHNLYLIGKTPNIIYSDMNKFGASWYPFMIFFLYWGLFHFGIAILTILLWQRGSIITWKDRFIKFKSCIRLFQKRILFGSFACWIILGGFIFYNTNILNTYQNKFTQEKKLVAYELQYKKFEKEIQPEIKSVCIKINLFPEKQSMNAQGIFKYKNCSTKPITKILLNISQDTNINYLNWNKQTSLVHIDKCLGVNIFNLAEPLLPNESIELSFQLNVKPKGFKNSEFSKKIIENGTFFYGTDFFPFIGYNQSSEINNEKIRQKYNLPKKPRMHDINDAKALNKTYVSQEGTWIDFETTISTSKDQIAIAPGYLVKQWQENDRIFFYYKMEKPILNFYAFLSGRYKVKYDQWNDVKIEIYHHPHHTMNISRMIQSIKKSLDYYTKNFSPYQFSQIRIIEFPRYATFAQSFPNTIPYSESIGFISKPKDKNSEDIDYVFYVTAHEMAHQWWGHQVVGGNVQGSTMLSESLAQYSALMVQEKEYGQKQMKKFLKYEMDKYLQGRSGEQKKELPLMYDEGQHYIHYNKGSLIFYALKDFLGEETVNKVLKEYINDVAFQKSTFTNSVELINHFKKVVPEDKKYLIEDFFETITFYENSTKNVAFTKKDDKYQIIIESDNKKFHSDELGIEHEILMDDYIDIGIFDKEGNILYLEKHKIKSGKNIFHIQVDKKPYYAGVDPINKLIDKNSKNHLLKAIEIKK